MWGWKYLVPLYISWRVFYANRIPIMDCDEVYNYWEPLHFLSYGHGLQTWEYAPMFALRTYAYLHPLEWFSRLFVSPIAPYLAPYLVDYDVTTPKLAIFLVLRSSLATLSAISELFLIFTLSEDVPFAESLTRQTMVPVSVSYAMALMMLTSTGMTHAASALLPSSSIMIVWMVCAACYVRNKIRLFCALAVIATLCFGWPFGVISFIPMAVDILRRCSSPIRLLMEVTAFSILIQLFVMLLDYQQYGKWTSATYNIFRYNAQGGGDELYGTEPASYYVKNLLLNHNYLSLFGILFLPFCAVLRKYKQPLPNSLICILGSLYPWLTIVVPRPHKEERFLFPIYPSLVLASVVCVHQIWEFISVRVFSGQRQRIRHIWIIFLLPSCVISYSRTMALSKYYTAPFKVYASLPPHSNGTVCTCGEWYRFPSSYFLPSGYRLGFLPSSFTGQLPKYFEQDGSRSGLDFNNVNFGNPKSYIDPKLCDYIIDIESASSDSECLLVVQEASNNKWIRLIALPFLNAAATSSLHRILYIPFIHKGIYDTYAVYTKPN
jgi:alpha-1,2-mannosyltransferase